MKKLFAILAVMGVLSFGMTQTAMAQDSTATAAPAQTEQVAAADEAEAAPVVVEEGGLHKELKTKFIEVTQASCLWLLSHWYLVWLSVLNVLFT